MQSFLTPRRLLILVILLLVVTSFLPGPRATALASPVRAIVETLAAPIRYPLHALGASVRAEAPRDLQLTEPTNRGHDLRRIAQLEDEVDRLREEVRQLRRVRSIIGETAPLVQVDAAVTGVTGPRAAPILRIDRGASAGIEKRQIVVSGFHLVGEVVIADPMTSQVKPITSADTKVFVRLMPREEATLREGPGVWLDWNPEERAFVQQISTAIVAEVGDLAVLADDGWRSEARGFFIGQVTAIRDYKPDPYNFKELVVRPTFLLEQLRRVTVLVPMEER